MRRKLVLKVIPHSTDGFHVQVTEQTYIGDNFGNPRGEFTSSTGLILGSCSCPEAYEDDDTVYVRGDATYMDRQHFTVYTREFMQRIMHAVMEYNRYALVDTLPSVPTGGSSFIVE